MQSILDDYISTEDLRDYPPKRRRVAVATPAASTSATTAPRRLPKRRPAPTAKFEAIYHENLQAGKVSSRQQLDYTWCQIRSKYAADIRRGVVLLEDCSPDIASTEKAVHEVPLICSEEDLSKLAAKQIKAEMLGDTALAMRLKEQLEEARKIVKEKGFAKQPSKKEVILSKINARGQAQPLQTTQDKISDYKQKTSNKYFDDNSKYSLKEMCNESAELDYESGKISKKLSQKLAVGQQEEREILAKQCIKRMASLESCEYCLDQPRMKKHLVVDIGNEVYISIPDYQIITEGHCLIVPKTHVSSLLSLDENEWREVNDFKNHLRSLYRSLNKSVIFLETSMNFRHFPHAVLECIPVPEEDGHMAPFYFKKAIQESETEWAHNKKLIDVTNKGLKHSVPSNLPYFCVEFDPKVHAGYAHVIEDEKYFPVNFGKEIIGGMLDIDYNYLYKNKKEDALKKSKEVVEFQKKWKRLKVFT